MLTCKVDFKCILCDEEENFYIMPFKEKTKDNSFLNSLNRFLIQCKKCGKNYTFKFKIEAV
jgi:hypothetical protein